MLLAGAERLLNSADETFNELSNDLVLERPMPREVITSNLSTKQVSASISEMEKWQKKGCVKDSKTGLWIGPDHKPVLPKSLSDIVACSLH